ncbi:hypothetical protein [Pseudomonas brassicacearum]|uniref:hypothetical protein n=1 Tax=Pseudomonas brassicacearum TaxID=930166 RepID=UPI0011CE3451|nr:hypothetical protein [Pseudomonas brassicacearum]
MPDDSRKANENSISAKEDSRTLLGSPRLPNATDLENKKKARPGKGARFPYDDSAYVGAVA